MIFIHKHNSFWSCLCLEYRVSVPLECYASIITWVPDLPATSHRSTTVQHLPTDARTQLRSHPNSSFASILNTDEWPSPFNVIQTPCPSQSTWPLLPWGSHHFSCGLCLELSKCLCFQELPPWNVQFTGAQLSFTYSSISPSPQGQTLNSLVDSPTY